MRGDTEVSVERFVIAGLRPPMQELSFGDRARFAVRIWPLNGRSKSDQDAPTERAAEKASALEALPRNGNAAGGKGGLG